MKYTTIYNDPTARAKVSHGWTYWDDAFTDEELQKVIDYCDSHGVEPGTTFSDDQDTTNKVRRSGVRFHPRNDDTAWIFDKLNFIIQSSNEMYYGYNLNGYSDFQYTTYTAEQEGKYDWHMDMALGNPSYQMFETRKLSLTLLLNDEFEGGEFQINDGSEEGGPILPSKKGRAFLFPSFMIHRVKPITSGIRKSLVVWVVGPKFT